MSAALRGFAVSNIAWEPEEAGAAYALLAANDISGLEIAPGLFLGAAADPFAPTPAEAEAALAPMHAAGLELVSMQSLLFGVQGAALFGDEAARDRFRTGMERAIGLAGTLGIPNLVFGSPGQRNVPEGLDPAEARARAAEDFRRLGDLALDAGTFLGVEFNPAVYGTNFLNEGADALAFVEEVDHPAVSLILDVGAMAINGQRDRIAELARAGAASGKGGRISHVHLSEPQLAPAPADAREAAAVIEAVAGAGYGRWISIEMKAAGLAALEAALGRLAAARALAANAATAG